MDTVSADFPDEYFFTFILLSNLDKIIILIYN